MTGKRAAPGHIRRHPDRLAIELASIGGMSLARVEERFGVNRHAVWKHMKALDPAYRAALISDVPLEELAQRAAEDGLSLLDHFDVLVAGLARARLEAIAAGDHYAHVALANALTNALKEKGRLNGELRKTPTITNITHNTAILMASPMMQRLHTMLAQRLAPHPAALEAVLEGLAELEGSETGREAAPAPATRMIEGTAHAA